jgi:small subunit ribosomal protein S6
MPQNVYECMFLLDTNKVAGDVANIESQLLSLVQKHNAEPLAHRPWDERRLAYAINKHKKGLYYLMYLRTDGKNLAGIEHDIALNETIIRSMILKIDPKLVDDMLALVKSGHAPALHSLQDEPGEETRIDDDSLNESKPRRSTRQETADKE